MLLRDIAHTRTGDKGNRSTLSVIAYDPKNYERLENFVTPEIVLAHVEATQRGPIELYSLP